MMDTVVFEYGFLGVIIVLMFFSFLISIDKMLYIIVATTCSNTIILGSSGCLLFLASWIAHQSSLTLFGFSAQQVASFVLSAETTISLLILIGTLIYTIQYSLPAISMNDSLAHSKLMQLLLSPLAIISVIISLTVAVLGIDIFSWEFIMRIAQNTQSAPILSQYLLYVPLLLILQVIITMILIFPKKPSEHDFPSYPVG